MSAVRTGEIKALTGLRIVAALWVVFFHFRPLLWEASPRLTLDVSFVLPPEGTHRKAAVALGLLGTHHATEDAARFFKKRSVERRPAYRELMQRVPMVVPWKWLLGRKRG